MIYASYICEKEMATHRSILAWEIPWTEKPGGQRSAWDHKELDMTNTFINVYVPCPVARGILISQTGIEPRPTAVEAWNPNHWTTSKFPKYIFNL